MYELTRRRLLETTAGLGVLGALPVTAGDTTGSPNLERFVQPVPRPDDVAPAGTRDGVDYYELSMGEFQQQFHPELPPTTVWGFEGSVPGPVIRANRNERIAVRYDNTGLPSDHLLEIDDRIPGTSPDEYDHHDGPVPDVRTVIHQHGLNVEPESDGQAEAWKSPDGVTGPRFEKHVHDIPNRQPRTTTTYHDHALGISRLNNYLGLNGFYIIEDQRERQLGLPTGEYDIPLMLQDKIFESDGSLHYPGEFIPNFSGDTAVVNGAVWPYLEVEPRRYRLRLVNQSNGRTFSLGLENDAGGDVPTIYQFAPDQGYLDSVVPIGHDGDLETLTIAPFERAEVVVDFAGYAGETFTVTNDAAFPFSGGSHGEMEMGDHEESTETGDHNESMGMGGSGDMETGDHNESMGMGGSGDMEMGGHGGGEYASELPEVMQIRVADPSGGVEDGSTPPTELSLPEVPSYEESAATETREMTLGMEMRNGLRTHVLNGKTFHDGGDYATPQLGATEVWELTNETMHTHPIHVHLVEFRVIGRGPDGTEPPEPNERGPKDVVRVNPDETVRIITKFGDFTGQYPWHCHVLEHEEQGMMRPFEVVEGESGQEPGEAGSQGNSSTQASQGGGQDSQGVCLNWPWNWDEC